MGSRAQKIWPVWIIFIAAISIEIMPLSSGWQSLRPPLPAMVLIYWAMMWPHKFALLTGFAMGLTLDILHGQLLGENALAFSIVAYIVVRFHLQIRIFPLWQLTMTVFGLLAVTVFTQVVVEGIAFGTVGLERWPRVVSGTVLWPILMGLMDRTRMQLEDRRDEF